MAYFIVPDASAGSRRDSLDELENFRFLMADSDVCFAFAASCPVVILWSFEFPLQKVSDVDENRTTKLWDGLSLVNCTLEKF